MYFALLSYILLFVASWDDRETNSAGRDLELIPPRTSIPPASAFFEPRSTYYQSHRVNRNDSGSLAMGLLTSRWNSSLVTAVLQVVVMDSSLIQRYRRAFVRGVYGHLETHSCVMATPARFPPFR